MVLWLAGRRIEARAIPRKRMKPGMSLRLPLRWTTPGASTGGEHRGMRGSGGGLPEASFGFWFWPPVPAAARRIRVIVSTLREAAWAEVGIPGRSG
jgi:hypothetical protein